LGFLAYDEAMGRLVRLWVAAYRLAHTASDTCLELDETEVVRESVEERLGWLGQRIFYVDGHLQPLERRRRQTAAVTVLVVHDPRGRDAPVEHRPGKDRWVVSV
jgi:hypothetical protein